jgi:DNA-binding NarL/FixJ family response regulator
MRDSTHDQGVLAQAEVPLKRLLIVADHPFAIHAVRAALRHTGGFRAVGFLDGRHAVRSKLLALRPDVVIIDEMRAADHTLARLREVDEETPDAKAFLLTERIDDDWIQAAFDAGADAVVSKSVPPLDLGTLLRETVRENIFHRHQPTSNGGACPLTAREVEILRLAAQGYTNRRIARELWIAEQTVKFHLSNTYRKLGVTNRTQASSYAYANSLVGGAQQIAS